VLVNMTSPTKEETMIRPQARRARAGLALVAAVALAMLAVAGIAAAKDGHHDRRKQRDENAGKIASFETTTGRLTISLFGGDTISGLVTDRTRIKCEDEHSPDVTVHARHGEEEPGDDHGGHGEEPGDDNGGHGEEPGDDHGNHGELPGDDNGGDNSGPGSSHSGRGPSGHDDNGTGADCTTSDLIVGATVEEADLELEHGSATFDEVELAG
jgi:hypothetical protein